MDNFSQLVTSPMQALMEDIGPNHSTDRVWQTEIAEMEKTTTTYRHPTIPSDDNDEDDEEDMIGTGAEAEVDEVDEDDSDDEC